MDPLQDMLGNFPKEAAMISFSHDLQAPELDVKACHPANNRNATEQDATPCRVESSLDRLDVKRAIEPQLEPIGDHPTELGA
eukprot:s3606_g16.t1